MDPRVILETALRQKEISAIEALMLLQDKSEGSNRLFEVAERVNEEINGRTVTYVRAKKVHYTNVCRADCRFCSFHKKKNHKNTFALSIEEIVKAFRDRTPIRQIVLSGALNPELSLAFHIELVETLREEFPNLHIQGYAPAEIHFIARRSRTTPFDVLRRLKTAGLDSLPGDSAEILNDKVRKKICPEKLRTADWVDIIKSAHRLGMPTTATMLFGHIEDEIHICEHLEIIKNIQRETGGISTFLPIPFVPKDTVLGRDRKVEEPPSLEKIQRITAVARLFFGALLPNIGVDWKKIGLKAGAQCFRTGANDLGEVSIDRHDIRAVRSKNTRPLDRKTIRRVLQPIGRIAEQRQPHTFRTMPTPAPTRKLEEILI